MPWAPGIVAACDDPAGRGPNGERELKQTTIGIHLAKKKPARTLAAVQIPPVFGALYGLDIPAGEPDYVVADSFTLPIAVEASRSAGTRIACARA